VIPAFRVPDRLSNTLAFVGTARRLERRIERILDGLAGLMFGGELHPSEFGIHVLREADLAATDGPAGPTIPNVYHLTVHTDQQAPEALERSLETLIEETAAERGWRLEGPATITIDHSNRVSRTDVSCTMENVPGPRSAWAHLMPAEGSRLPLAHNRETIGRATECDVRIEDAGISRFHALIWREGGRMWITDLGSSNGTSVDGVPVTKPTLITNGSVVAIGPATFDFHTA
jgi:hypothetical protein